MFAGKAALGIVLPTEFSNETIIDVLGMDIIRVEKCFLFQEVYGVWHSAPQR